VKRFLLFAGDEYYSRGGWSDFKGSFDSIIGAVREVDSCGSEWYQVVDSVTGTIIAQNYIIWR
jgi:hypothetical protein